MSDEQGLLASLIEKLREEFQGLIRYEVLRGLDKPEANNWQWAPIEINNLGEFLNCTLYNTLYNKEQITVLEFLKKPATLVSKFKFLRETGNFYFPNDAYLTQDFLNDIIEGNKSVLLTKNLNLDPVFFTELKTLSQIFINRDALKSYLPGNFNEKFHDNDYVTNVFITVDPEYAQMLFRQNKIVNDINGMSLPRLDLKLSFAFPIIPSAENLWESMTSAMGMMNELKMKEIQMREIEGQEVEAQKTVNAIASKNYNEDMFDQILEVSS